MQRIIWDDEELDKHITDVLNKYTSMDNPLGPNTILNKIKTDFPNVGIGIIRVKDSLNRISDKIKKTPGTHTKYYI